jgi:hypothetical protein
MINRTYRYKATHLFFKRRSIADSVIDTFDSPAWIEPNGVVAEYWRVWITSMKREYCRATTRPKPLCIIFAATQRFANPCGSRPHILHPYSWLESKIHYFSFLQDPAILTYKSLAVFNFSILTL